jgi:decaprenylphospho-beta-D-ribofuranose 2-oxidase
MQVIDECGPQMRPGAASERPAELPQPREELLAGWGNYARDACRVYRPETAQDLEQVVAGAREANLISRGLGRGYGDAAVNGRSGVVEHLKLNRVLAFDERAGVLICEAGASIADIIDFALARGWFPLVTPGTKFVTVGGAIAADVHGKNHHHDGSFASCLVDFRLLAASGEVLTCSRDENASVFWATLGGMGLTGAILDARIRLRPVESAYVTVDYERTANLDESLAAFAEGDQRYTYSVAWIDCLARGAALGRSVLLRGCHTPCDELPANLAQTSLDVRPRRGLSVPCHLPGGLLNRWSVRAFNALYYRRHGDRRAIVAFDQFFHPLDSVKHWNRIYGRRGFMQYQAALPRATSRHALVEMLEAISRAGQASFLAVLKSFGPGNEGLLSFPIEGHTLALDLPNHGVRLQSLAERLDAIVMENGGRVYLAKDPRLGRAAFDRMYAQADEFRRVKARLDPYGRFSSSLARRLGLTPTVKPSHTVDATT